jgi:hypothetical protein
MGQSQGSHSSADPDSADTASTDTDTTGVVEEVCAFEFFQVFYTGLAMYQ